MHTPPVLVPSELASARTAVPSSVTATRFGRCGCLAAIVAACDGGAKVASSEEEGVGKDDELNKVVRDAALRTRTTSVHVASCD